MVLVDALAIIMGHEERELCKPGHLGLVLIVDTATALLGSREMVSYKLENTICHTDSVSVSLPNLVQFIK